MTCPNCGEKLHLLANEEYECTVCEHNSLACSCQYCIEGREIAVLEAEIHYWVKNGSCPNYTE